MQQYTAREYGQSLLSNVTSQRTLSLKTTVKNATVAHPHCHVQIVDGEMYIVGETAGFYEFNHMTKASCKPSFYLKLPCCQALQENFSHSHERIQHKSRSSTR